MKTLKWSFGLLIGVFVGLVICLWAGHVPTRSFKDSEWFQLEEPSLTRIEPDKIIQGMIKRARIEHFVSPAISDKRVIFFDRAWKAPPNDAYLMFGVANRADVAVVYRGGLEDGRLFWKAENTRSP